ncbi:MAG TPA: hypothetical protein VI298_09145 [Geobacteraceae bacterium]
MVRRIRHKLRKLSHIRTGRIVIRLAGFLLTLGLTYLFLAPLLCR